MVSILCDHISFLVIREGIYAPYTSPEGHISFYDAPAWLTAAHYAERILDVLGRAAFPIFIFLLTEGFLHTRSKKRYLLALPALLLYNGERGVRGSKYFFCIFYPTHFLVLTGIGALCARI